MQLLTSPLSFFARLDLRGVPNYVGPGRHVPDHDCARRNHRAITYLYAGHHNRAGTEHTTLADPRVQIDSTRHIVSKDNSLLFNDASGRDMYASWPSPVDQGCRSDPRRRMDIHPPNMNLDEANYAPLQTVDHKTPRLFPPLRRACKCQHDARNRKWP